MIRAIDWDKLAEFLCAHNAPLALVQDCEDDEAGVPIYYQGVGMPAPTQEKYIVAVNVDEEIVYCDCTTTMPDAYARWGRNFREWPEYILRRIGMGVESTRLIEVSLHTYLDAVSHAVERIIRWNAQLHPNDWHGSRLLDAYDEALGAEIERYNHHPAAWALLECGKLVVQGKLLTTQEMVRVGTMPELSFIYTGYATYRFDRN